MNSLIKRALISEKSFGKVAESKYTFVVDKAARKEEIVAVCEDLFGVKVVAVATANILGKVKRTKKGEGRRSDYKKAVVTLKPGQKIDLFEIETAEDKKEAKETKTKEKKEKTASSSK